MFAIDPNRDELRQGDIIQGLYFPSMICQTLSLLGTAGISPESMGEGLSLSAVTKRIRGIDWLSAHLEVFRRFAVVLSQCCDLERRQGKLDILFFVVAPLLEVPYQIRTDPEKFAELQLNSLEQYVNLFYIPHTPPLPQAYVVHFNMVVSLPRSQYDFAIAGKVLQMTDGERVRFKLKLGHHFSRLTREEIDTNLSPPS